MTPAVRPAPYEQVRAALDQQWDVLTAHLATADPTAPTRCAGWTVRELDRHLGSITRGLAHLAAADEPVRAGAGTGSLVQWSLALPDLAGVIDADARDPTNPGLIEAVPPARAALAGADPLLLVRQRTGVHRLGDAVLFRLLESVVHGTDLGVEPAPLALRVTVRALAALLAERHPGHGVEVRVPPHVALQCLPGPRHTRGTPPHTVEADPLAFLAVVTGRLSWEHAVAHGQIRVRGERGDLASLMPLLS